MASRRSVGHCAVGIVLLLLLWPDTSAGDGAAPSPAIAESLRITVLPVPYENFAVHPVPEPRPPQDWGETNTFLRDHFLPKITRSVRRAEDFAPTMSDRRRTKKMRRYVEEDAHDAVRDFLKESALEPVRDRVLAHLEDALERRKARRAAGRPASAIADRELTLADAPEADGATSGNADDPEKRGDVNVGFGISGGSPTLRAKYRAAGMKIDFDLETDSTELRLKSRKLRLNVDFDGGLPEVRMRYQAGKVKIDAGFAGTLPQIRLDYPIGRSTMRFRLLGDGRIAVEYWGGASNRPARVNASIDPVHGEYSATFGRRF
jgi:hypothetical protein